MKRLASYCIATTVGLAAGFIIGLHATGPTPRLQSAQVEAEFATLSHKVKAHLPSPDEVVRRRRELKKLEGVLLNLGVDMSNGVPGLQERMNDRRVRTSYERLRDSLGMVSRWITSSAHHDTGRSYSTLFGNHYKSDEVGESWVQLLNALAVDPHLGEKNAGLLGNSIADELNAALTEIAEEQVKLERAHRSSSKLSRDMTRDVRKAYNDSRNALRGKAYRECLLAVQEIIPPENHERLEHLLRLLKLATLDDLGW